MSTTRKSNVSMSERALEMRTETNISSSHRPGRFEATLSRRRMAMMSPTYLQLFSRPVFFCRGRRSPSPRLYRDVFHRISVDSCQSDAEIVYFIWICLKTRPRPLDRASGKQTMATMPRYESRSHNASQPKEWDRIDGSAPQIIPLSIYVISIPNLTEPPVTFRRLFVSAAAPTFVFNYRFI